MAYELKIEPQSRHWSLHSDCWSYSSPKRRWKDEEPLFRAGLKPQEHAGVPVMCSCSTAVAEDHYCFCGPSGAFFWAAWTLLQAAVVRDFRIPYSLSPGLKIVRISFLREIWLNWSLTDKGLAVSLGNQSPKFPCPHCYRTWCSRLAI